MNDMQFDVEILMDFISEADESLLSANHRIADLGENPTDKDAIDEVFRCFHSIKGNSAALGKTKLSKFAHTAEHALDKIRKGKVTLNDERLNLLNEASDILRDQIARFESEPESDAPEETTKAFLERLYEGFSDNVYYEKLSRWLAGATKDPQFSANPLFHELQEIIESGGEEGKPKPKQTSSQTDIDVTKEKQTETKENETTEKEEKSQKQSKSSNAGSLRVDVAKMERIVQKAGDLFFLDERLKHASFDVSSMPVNLLAETPPRIHQDLRQFYQSMQEVSDKITKISLEFDAIMDGLYDELLEIRRFPVIQITRMLERIIREIMMKTGKKIHFEVEGEMLRLDRRIIESLKDPLVHIVRNAADHGIEAPEERAKTRKAEEAAITMRFLDNDEEIAVVIADDGRGMDAERIKQSALEKGVISVDEAETMPEKEALELIFHAGFSTAKQLSDISGRGVGMDVVRSNLKKMGGAIDIETTLGKGSTFTLTIPKAGSPVVDGLAFSIGGQTILLPPSQIIRLIEWQQLTLVTLPSGAVGAKIEETLAPIIDLSQKSRTVAVKKPEALLGLLIQNKEKQMMVLATNEALGRQKTLIQANQVPGEHRALFNGSFVLGDGGVGFLLDTEALFQKMQRDIDNLAKTTKPKSLPKKQKSNAEKISSKTMAKVIRMPMSNRNSSRKSI